MMLVFILKATRSLVVCFKILFFLFKMLVVQEMLFVKLFLTATFALSWF